MPLYKGKGDTKKCLNYRSLKMLKHAKILEKVFQRRIEAQLPLVTSRRDSCPEKAQ